MKKENYTNPEDKDNNIIETSDEQTEMTEDKPAKKWYHRFLNLHVALIVIFVFVVCICVSRLSDWGVHVDLDKIFEDGPGTYDNTLDEIVPLLDEAMHMVEQEQIDTIVAFGNAPFSDDRGSKDNLASIIEDMTGATVYNCAIQESYLAADLGNYDETLSPYDAYCFYYLAHLASGTDMTEHFTLAKDTLTLLSQYRDEYRYTEEMEYAYNTLSTLDFSTVDAIVLMYDATDYYKGHSMYNDENPLDITCFTGGMEAGIDIIQQTYPHIRIIVLSPTYAYAVDENGNYVSSDQYTYGEQDVFSTYVIKQCASAISCGVSFVDNLYGTITEDNAKDYLIDNVHLNVKGRKLVAERFEYALNYYINGYGATE